MGSRNTLALIVAYCLSRLDAVAYEAFGHGERGATHEALGQRLGVKASTIKNMRDEFDVVHPNARRGWHQRPMIPSRIRVVEMLRGLDDAAVLQVALGVLGRGTGAEGVDEVCEAIEAREQRPGSEDAAVEAGSRMLTGHRAEEAFRAWHATTGQPFAGVLDDVRLLGGGCDFVLRGAEERVAWIEVKGLAALRGDVTLTAREWEEAARRGPAYILAVVSGVGSEAMQVRLVGDPAAGCTPRVRVAVRAVSEYVVPAACVFGR